MAGKPMSAEYRLNRAIIRKDGGPGGECWEVKPTARGGYGKFKVGDKTILSHRYSFMVHHGVDPAGFMVCHSCDNPCCINPDHLFVGSAMDNMHDKIDKGRHKGAKRGSDHHSAKLSDSQFNEIRQKLMAGERQHVLARNYGVSQSIISRIKNGKVRHYG